MTDRTRPGRVSVIAREGRAIGYSRSTACLRRCSEPLRAGVRHERDPCPNKRAVNHRGSEFLWNFRAGRVCSYAAMASKMLRDWHRKSARRLRATADARRKDLEE